MDNLYFKKLPSNALPSVSGNDVVLVETDSGDFVLIDSNGAKTLLNVDKAFPVGTVLCRANDVSPASDIGGTWQKVAEGQTIIGASTDYPLNSTGGAKTHNHALGTVANAFSSPAQALIQVNVIDDVPCVAMTVGGISSAEQPDYTPTERIVGMEWQRDNYGSRSATVPVVGKTQGHSSLQPYVAKNYWQRVA